MKKVLFFLLLFSAVCIHAQFVDDMESYTDGQPISGVGPWLDFGCGGGAGCALMSSSEQAYSGSLSGLVPDDNTTDAVLDLGNKLFGTWALQFWAYIPSNKEAYWNMMGSAPDGSYDWTGGWFFFNQGNLNPGHGLIDNIAIEPVTFSFPHDAWFSIIMCWDVSLGIEASTWSFSIDGVVVIPNGTPYKDGAGDSPPSLGGINYFSISSDNHYYLDDFYFTDDDWWCYISVDEIESEKFTISPNPVRDILYIDNSSRFEIESIQVYDVMGRAVFRTDNLSKQLDVSSLKAGAYLIKIETDIGVVTKKIIKE